MHVQIDLQKNTSISHQKKIVCSKMSIYDKEYLNKVPIVKCVTSLLITLNWNWTRCTHGIINQDQEFRQRVQNQPRKASDIGLLKQLSLKNNFL